MLRDLTTKTNRRQGIAALLALAGLAAPTTTTAKKKKKGKKVGDICQNDNQCSKINGICAGGYCSEGTNVCCLSIGKACSSRCDCCSYSETGVLLYCMNGVCSRW